MGGPIRAITLVYVTISRPSDTVIAVKLRQKDSTVEIDQIVLSRLVNQKCLGRYRALIDAVIILNFKQIIFCLVFRIITVFGEGDPTPKAITVR